MANIKLYEIEQEYLSIAQQLIDLDGELTTELEEQLTINREQLENKGRAYSFVIKDMETEIDIIDAEMARLNQLKERRVKAADKLKERVKDAMLLFGITEIKSPTLKINFRKSESVEVDNIELLESDYKVTKTTVSADKVKIKAAIKEGVNVNGAVLVENNNLQIK
jgi:hypothetical protein